MSRGPFPGPGIVHIRRSDQALATAAICTEQAQVIVDAVDDLPDTIEASVVADAEKFLLVEAAEAEEARRLEKEEAEARAKASFTMSDDGHGKVHGRFSLPSLHGSMLRKALIALAAPGRHPDRPANTPNRHALWLASLEYVETRRLACRAGVGPVVLGGKSQPLDVGRQARLHTKGQRIALGLRDGGCTAVGCDRPPSMCPPRRPLEPRRPDKRQGRPAALPATSHPRPRPRLRDDAPAGQQGRLPPQDVDPDALPRLGSAVSGHHKGSFHRTPHCVRRQWETTWSLPGEVGVWTSRRSE